MNPRIQIGTVRGAGRRRRPRGSIRGCSEVDASGEPLTERLVAPVGRPHSRERRCSTSARTGCSPTTPAPIESIWPEVRDTLTPALRERRQLYADDLPARSLDAALDRFLASIAPVHEFGKLGAVVFPFPSYFVPGAERARLPRVAARAQRRPPDRGRAAPPRLGRRASTATRRWQFLTEHRLALRVRRRAAGLRQLAPAAVGRDHRHRVRPLPRPQRRRVGARRRHRRRPVRVRLHATATSSRGCRASRSWRRPRGRCT